eukprot:148977_1
MFNKRWLSLPTLTFATIPALTWNNKSQQNQKDKLLLVHVFHRHGDRTPWYPIYNKTKSKQTWVPTIAQRYSSFDPVTCEPNVDNIYSWENITSTLTAISLAYKHDNWKKSSPSLFHSIIDHHMDKLADLSTTDNKTYPFLGQLTDTGCKQLETLGELLREKYVNTMKYLPSEYDANNNNLHCHSTNLARTIQSADCVLSKLYPKNKRKNNALIPLHVDVDLTYLSPTRMKFRFCDKLFQKAKQNERKILKTIDNKFLELTNIVMKYYSVGKHEWKYCNPAIAFDGMICRICHNVSDKPNNLSKKDMNDFGIYMVQLQCGMMSLDRESLKLTWGNVLYKMIDIMKSTNEMNSKGYMQISSCHDDSLLAILCSIYGNKIFDINLEWPPYGSYIIFELWKNGITNEKYVKVMYNGELLNAFDGKDYIDLNSLENKWRDIMIDEASYFNGACIC